MKISVVGATGPTGALVVEQAIARGHEVTAFVRNPDKLSSRPGLTVVAGALADTASFASAIAGSDVVICTLGTRLWRERGFMTAHLPEVTAAMQKAGVNRLVLMSALGGGRPPVLAKGIARLVFTLLSTSLFKDRTVSEIALAKTGLDHSILYPGFLGDDATGQEFQVEDIDRVKDVKSQRKIARAHVATALVSMAERAPASGSRFVIAPVGAITV